MKNRIITLKLTKKLCLYTITLGLLTSCHNKYEIHKGYLSDAYEKSIDSAVFVPYRQGDKWFYVDRRTKGPYAGHAKAFEGEWDRVYTFNSNKLARIVDGDKGSFIDTKGKTVIPYYDDKKLGLNVYDGVVLMRDKENLKGGININGDTVISFKYKEIGVFIEGVAIVTYQNDNDGIISIKGKDLVDSLNYFDLNYNYYGDTSNIISYGVKVDEELRYGFLNRELKKITEATFEKEPFFLNKRGLVTLNNRIGYIDSKGNIIIPCIYDEAELFYNDQAVVAKENKYGTIDKSGKVVIPFKYDMLGGAGFENNIMPAKKEGRWGIINSQGKVLVDFIFDDANIFKYKYGLVAMKNSNGWGMIDTLGNEIVNFKFYTTYYKYPDCITPNRIVVEDGNTNKGIINRSGKLITPIKYRSIGGGDGEDFFENGLIPVSFKEDGKYRKGYIDIWGKEYFED